MCTRNKRTIGVCGLWDSPLIATKKCRQQLYFGEAGHAQANVLIRLWHGHFVLCFDYLLRTQGMVVLAH